VRVITGQFKGRRLTTVPDRTIRPVTDRVKQTIFDSLATRLDLQDTQVLDLFAGTGSLGIEALSRGAKHCTFVDSSDQGITCIRQNLNTLGCFPAATVVQMDAFRFIDECRDQFALIFADPPYSYAETSRIPSAVFSRNLLEPSGYLLIEHTKNMIFEESPLTRLDVVKKFGSTFVSFYVHKVS
jgi:16S rRNA (guanine(966)-N(2))-methyltransferase RsmD